MIHKYKALKRPQGLRQFIFLALLLLTVLPAHAVLKEKNLSNTLSILRTELYDYRVNLELQSQNEKQQQAEVFKNVMSVLTKSNQNSLMLYSQRDGYTFDLTYACHQATEQYQTFKNNVAPFRMFIQRNNYEIARYDSLINNLSTMPVQALSPRAQIDRNVCLTLAVNIRHTLQYNSDQFSQYVTIYKYTESQLKRLNDYAIKRYATIQNSIFLNNGNSYFNILRSLSRQVNETKESVANKYFVKTNVTSQWDVRVIFMFFASLAVYALIVLLINSMVIKFVLPRFVKKRNKQIKENSTCFILASSAIMLAMIMGWVKAIFSDQSFLDMASGLLVEFTWLLAVVLISLLLRLNGPEIKSGFRIYSPVMFICFLIISFRIVLIPNDFVNLLLPPILVLCTFWQWWVIKRNNRNFNDDTDLKIAYISLAIFVVSVICSWSGYYLLAVQLLIWWTMQLTCILTLACIWSFMKDYGIKHKIEEMPITRTWLFRFAFHVLIPSLSIGSFLLAIYWATAVFNLSDTLMVLFNKNFIDTKNFSVSLSTISIVLVLFFLFKYINHTVKSFLKYHYKKKDPKNADSRIVMLNNIIQILVWGIWLLITLALMHISSTWLVVISGGLSTGIGFASKDILENIYYGISLMAGRVKVGDFIICDGIRGKVSSISYTSTMIEAIDGSVIAFQNSQLFTKNYKNMTRNHDLELDILEVGVAYGTDIKKVKQLLHDAIINLSCVKKERDVKIVLKEFGDSSITLKILVWVNVFTQYGDDGMIMECIYNTLNDNHIEIPFPQRDVRIIHDTDAKA